MIKIAIPTKGTDVDNHFGHCEMYTVFTSEDNRTISKMENLPSPQGCGCKSNIAFTFREMGVKIMLAGGIGEGAINVLKNQGISVVRGCSGNVITLAEKYLSGDINDSGESCSHHHNNGEEHSCNH